MKNIVISLLVVIFVSMFLVGCGCSNSSNDEKADKSQTVSTATRETTALNGDKAENTDTSSEKSDSKTKNEEDKDSQNNKTDNSKKSSDNKDTEDNSVNNNSDSSDSSKSEKNSKETTTKSKNKKENKKTATESTTTGNKNGGDNAVIDISDLL